MLCQGGRDTQAGGGVYQQDLVIVFISANHRDLRENCIKSSYMPTIKITLVQTNLYWDDIQANLDMLTEKINGITESTDLIVLPETFTTGFSMNTELAQEMDGSAVQWMKKTAAEKNAVVTGSLWIKEDGNLYNRLVWMQPDGDFYTYDKRHLFSLSKEKELYAQGHERLLVEYKGVVFCPLICYDLRFPVWSRNHADNPYDVLLYVANWPAVRRLAWKTLLPARAVENLCYVIGLSRVGADANEMDHTGDSMVVGPMGDILYHKERDEDVFTIELSTDEIKKVRSAIPFLNDADNFKILH